MVETLSQVVLQIIHCLYHINSIVHMCSKLTVEKLSNCYLSYYCFQYFRSNQLMLLIFVVLNICALI